jgi:lantibiotic modifying enzyme
MNKAFLGVMSTFAVLMVCVSPGRAENRSYRGAAIGAARWIAANGIEKKPGIVWAADPQDPKSVNTTLYAGTPGPILFLLEAYRYTGDTAYLEKARHGADALLISISEKDDTGLYTGLAGSGFTLGEAYLITHDRRYRDGAVQCVRWIEEKAVKTQDGAKWNDVTDIISGSSGTGLFLLWAADHLHAPGARELAIRAGEHLVSIGEPEPGGGQKWMMDKSYPFEMPNFCHGTAGVSYFLATLYRATERQNFLNASLAGAKYLISIANQTNRYFLLYHDNKNSHLFYLDWAHGPAGTAALFYRLYQITKDRKWMELVVKCAAATRIFGGPEKAFATIPPGSARTLTVWRDGYPKEVANPEVWNNASVCDGVAGESQFFYNVYLATGDRKWLEAAKEGSDELLRAADVNDGNYRWVQVETFVRPDYAIAQTGYMEGASGIGMWLLHFSAALAGSHRPVITFPDDPFPY